MTQQCPLVLSGCLVQPLVYLRSARLVALLECKFPRGRELVRGVVGRLFRVNVTSQGEDVAT